MKIVDLLIGIGLGVVGLAILAIFMYFAILSGIGGGG